MVLDLGSNLGPCDKSCLLHTVTVFGRLLLSWMAALKIIWSDILSTYWSEPIEVLVSRVFLKKNLEETRHVRRDPSLLKLKLQIIIPTTNNFIGLRQVEISLWVEFRLKSDTISLSAIILPFSFYIYWGLKLDNTQFNRLLRIQENSKESVQQTFRDDQKS